jgi:hypothetical protein
MTLKFLQVRYHRTLKFNISKHCLANVIKISDLSCFAQFTDKKRPQYLRKSKSNDYKYSTGEILQNMKTEGQCEID